MIWKLFGSRRRVEAALEQSVGYDISPNVLVMPANEDKPARAPLELETQPSFYFVTPWDKQKA